jgi:hypothetical protein
MGMLIVAWKNENISPKYEDATFKEGELFGKPFFIASSTARVRNSSVLEAVQ